MKGSYCLHYAQNFNSNAKSDETQESISSGYYKWLITEVLGANVDNINTNYWCFFLLQHFIFIISGFLAWLIPDVPQSVQNEIQKEKLLAYEAIHARHDAGKELGVKGGGKSQATSADSGWLKTVDWELSTCVH